jgi:hypothetical protein
MYHCPLASNFGYTLNLYRDLMYNEYLEALKPYGKTINGFLIVEGWHVHFIL